MRSGWLVLLGWGLMFVAVGAACALGGRDVADRWGVLLLYAAVIGAGATAAVMLCRGAGTTYGWAIESWALKPIALVGLLPLFLLLLFAVFGWNN